MTQNGAVVVSGASIVNTGSGRSRSTNAGNDFSNLPGNSFTGGAISLRDANDLTVTTLAAGANQSISVVAGLGLSLPGGVSTGSGDLTLSSGAVLTTPGILSGRNISLTGTGGVSIGNDVTASRDLSLATPTARSTRPAGAIASNGTTTVTAGVGTVTLAQPLNNFNSINVVSGSVVTINDSNALTAAANASGNLTITSTGPLSSGGTLSGANIALTGSAGINLGHNVNTSGTLQLTTANAAINQTAGAITVGGSRRRAPAAATSPSTRRATTSATSPASAPAAARCAFGTPTPWSSPAWSTARTGPEPDGRHDHHRPGRQHRHRQRRPGDHGRRRLRDLRHAARHERHAGRRNGRGVDRRQRHGPRQPDAERDQRADHADRAEPSARGRHDDGFRRHRQHQPVPGGQRLRHARRHRQHGHGARRQRPRARPGHRDHADARHQRRQRRGHPDRREHRLAARRRSPPAAARWP